jgi:ferredoxin
MVADLTSTADPEEGAVQVTVDFDRCEGHGLCTLAAPEVFSFDDRGNLRVSERTGPDHRAAVEESVRTCPALAIELVDAKPSDVSR